MKSWHLRLLFFAVIIGLVIGYVSISAKMKSSQEAAELMLLMLNKKQLIYEDKLSAEADLLLNEAKAKASLLKRSTIGGQRGSQKIPWRSGRWI